MNAMEAPATSGKQVCVDPRTSDLNITLLAFAAERRAAGHPPPAPAVRHLPPTGPTAAKFATVAFAAVVHTGTDRRTNTAPFHRPRSAQYASSVNNCCLSCSTSTSLMTTTD